MKIEVHILTNNHDWILPWTLRHYGQFASKLVVHDGGPNWTEGSVTRDLCLCHGADWACWDTAGELNDDLACTLKNGCWKGSEADWVIVADVDELVYFPAGAADTLAAYTRLGAAVIRPQGFEMFSEKLPDPGSHQIYDAIKDGATDEDWYSKPILFSPRLVADSGFGLGAHEARPVLKDGRALTVGKAWPHPNPPAYLLHFHQIGPAEFVAERYDATFRRFSQINLRHGWGNHTPGAVHVQEKRDLILPRLRRVIS